MNPVTPEPACTICMTPIAGSDNGCSCPGCSAVYHQECWDENGGCGVYGCKNAPVVEPRSAMEVPVSHWGQENKVCPSCSSRIAAAAVRCRQCGATFTSATPQDEGTFLRDTRKFSRQPGMRRMTVVIFILCVVPCTAPLGVPFGALWWIFRRHDVTGLPPFNSALLKIGLGVGLFEIAAVVLLSLVRSSMNSPSFDL